jgi:hypothetical protein
VPVTVKSEVTQGDRYMALGVTIPQKELCSIRTLELMLWSCVDEYNGKVVIESSRGKQREMVMRSSLHKPITFIKTSEKSSTQCSHFRRFGSLHFQTCEVSQQLVHKVIPRDTTIHSTPKSKETEPNVELEEET